MTDFGKLEIENGQVVTLKKNTYHLLPRVICEPLIRQGILEHLAWCIRCLIFKKKKMILELKPYIFILYMLYNKILIYV